MKKLTTRVLVLTTIALSAGAQTNQTSSVSNSTGGVLPESSSRLSLPEAKAGVGSRWGGSILLIYDKAMRVKGLNEDPEVVEFDTQTHFTLSYKMSERDSIAVVQRLFYSKSVVGNSTLDQAALGNLRI